MNEFKTLEEKFHLKVVRCTGKVYSKFEDEMLRVTGVDTPGGHLNEQHYTIAAFSLKTATWYSFKFTRIEDAINEFEVVEDYFNDK